MTKGNKPKNYFEKSFYIFYSFVGLSILLSVVFHNVSRSYSKKLNYNELQVNVINPLDIEELDSSNREYSDNLVRQNTTDTNPNIIDTELSKKILDNLGKKETFEYIMVVTDTGALNASSVQITTGDSVTFYNNSSKSINIKGESGWGSQNIAPKSFYTQTFFPSQVFSFIVEPFGTKGSIEVLNP